MSFLEKRDGFTFGVYSLFGDSNDLRLSWQDRGLISKMRSKVDKLVVILLSGRPMIITEELQMVDGFVAAWLPGSEGGSMAAVLSGDEDFTGKLAYTWPRSMDQIPFDFQNIPESGPKAPLFNFGFGLNYR